MAEQILPGMEVDTNRTQARTSPSPEGGRKRAAVEVEIPKTESGDDDFELAGTTLSNLAGLCKQLRNDLEHETSRRRDLRDELENEKLKLASNIMKTDSNTKAIQKSMQVLTSEGEHKDNVRILVIKKRNMNMRAFFANFVGFQNHLVQNAAVVQISSAGPVW